MAALASLTEMYTDSEGEDAGGRSERRDSFSDEFEEDKADQRKSSGIPKTPAREEPTKRARPSTLVSYLNDTVISDDDGEKDVVNRPEPMEITSDHETSLPPEEPAPEDKSQNNSAVDLPPEPLGKCSNEMQLKISSLTEKMKLKGHDMNLIIQERKSFRNPSIYEKLIQFCDINEFGTNYPPQNYDPHKWNKSSYYDELAKVQDKREKERKTSKVEVIMGTAKKPNGAAAAAAAAEEERKRKSKWDQVGLPGMAGVRPSSAAGLLTTLTSSSTGTKSTVISAFGSLPKKPKV